MPRAYGKHELQQLINASFRAGFRLGKAKAEITDDDAPHVDDVLAQVGIEHPVNVPWNASTPRSWHPKKESQG